MENQFALLENGQLHTDKIKKNDADEMLERHSRIFEDIHWSVVPMSKVNGMERMKGYLEKQRDIAVKYHS